MPEKKKALIVPSSTKRFRDSLSNLYPELSKAQLKPLSDVLLQKMSDYMDAGYSPTVSKPKPDGTLDIVVLYFEEEPKDIQKKKTRK